MKKRNEDVVLDLIEKGKYIVTETFNVRCAKQHDNRSTIRVQDADGKIVEASRARVIYKKFKGDIPKGRSVVHIDGDLNNYHPANLTTRG